MALPGRGIRRLLRLDTKRAPDAVREVDDEMRTHIAFRVEQLVAEGYDRASAEAEARRRFAHTEQTLSTLYHVATDRNQHMRMLAGWESLLQDTRYAARGLIRDPLFAVFIVLTLALGIGANVSAFSLVDRLLLRGPEHVRSHERVVRLYRHTQSTAAGEETWAWLPFQTYTNLRAGMQSLQTLGAYGVRPTAVGRDRAARVRRVAHTTGAFFQVLDVRPLAGRLFGPDEDGASAGPLTVISPELWRSEFNGDPAALGENVLIGGEPHTVVGIAPEGFAGPEQRRVAAWVLADSRRAPSWNWMVIGRLRGAATVASASADAASVHRASAESGPRHMREASIIAAPIRFGVSAQEPVETTIARWMAAVSAMILLIAFANVVNLILARLARRQRDLAIRIALGSGRARVARLLALEGALLALTGAAAALLIARVTEPIVRRALFGEDASWTFSLLDVRVLGIVLAVAFCSCVCAGILPALLHAADARFTAALKSGSQNGGSRSRLRSTLTVAQAALSVVLLVGAGLFSRSIMNVRAIDLGVQPDRVIVATATLPRPETLFGKDWFAPGLAAERDTYLRLLAEVRALPGVEHASVALGLPLDGGAFSTGVWVDDADAVPRAHGGAFIAAVADDYFETVGTRLLRGRAFSVDDRATTEPVVVIGTTMARTLFPGRDALGACVRLGGETVPCSRVVGIVADVRRTGLRSDPTMQFYIPFGQHTGFMGANLLVRLTAAGALPMARLREAILDAEPTVGAVDLQPLGAWLDGELRPLRLGMVTFGLSGALALLVAALGLYSLMTYMVAWRTREIGIRTAIGATGAQIMRLIISSGVGLAAIGIMIGLGVSAIGARWLQPQLFHTSARDPVVLAIVAVSLMLVALIAGWIPARRALAIRPTEALRTE